MNNSIRRNSLVVFLSILFLLNLTTATHYPDPWIDEVLYIDPAMNLVEGNGFTSSAWPSQSKDEFWASNTPLYTLLEAGWIKVFEPSLIVTRTFSYLLALLSGIFLSIGIKNFQLIRSLKIRNSCIAFLFMIFPVVYTYRMGRPDILCLLLASSTFLAVSFAPSKLRNTLLIFSSLLTPFANLAVVFYILTLLCLGLLFFGKKILKDAALIIVGISLGVLLMLGFYLVNDSLEKFLMLTVGSARTLLGQIAQYFILGNDHILEKFIEFPWKYLEALIYWPSTSLMMFAAYLLLLVPKINRNQINYFFILSIISVPLVLLFIGKYTWSYSWMHISILGIGIFYSIDRLDWHKHAIVLRSCTIPLFLSALIGFPMIIGITFYEWDERSRGPIQSFAEKHINPNDTVVIDPYIYFEAKQRAKEVISTNYGGGYGLSEIPEEQRRSVSKMIIPENYFNLMQSRYGGQWKVTDHFYLAWKKNRLIRPLFYNQFRIDSISYYETRKWDTLLVYERE